MKQVNEKRIKNLIDNKINEIVITIEEAKQFFDLGIAYRKKQAFTCEAYPFARYCTCLGYEVEKVIDFISDSNGPISGKIVLKKIECETEIEDDNQEQLIEDAISQSNYQSISYPNQLIPISRQLRALVSKGVKIDENNLVILSEKNLNIVKPLIINGIKGVSRKYGFKAKRVFDAFKGKAPQFPFTNAVAVHETIKQIDIDNSTMDHKNHGDAAIDFYTSYILNNNNHFVERLKSSDETINKQLVDDMIREFMATDQGYGARSLASKICKFMYQFDTNDDDKYFINDAIVRSIVPYYENKAGLEASYIPSDISYSDLHDRLSNIKRHLCHSLTKSEVDNIMWFSYKNWTKK